MSEPLVVLHVVFSLDLGGLERVVVDLVREGEGLGQRVAVVCLQQPGRLAPQVEALGARVACLGKPSGLHLRTMGRMGTLLRTLRPDIVHTHQIGALFYAGPAGRLSGARAVVHTEHGKHYPGRFRTRLLARLAGRWAERFFCVSQDIATAAVALGIVPSRKVRVVPNGIDTTRFGQGGDRTAVRRWLGLPPEAIVIGTVGRLDEIKRQDLLIRAFGVVRVRFPEVHLLLVGDGPRRDELRGLAEGLGLIDCVHFAGYQAEPERFLQAMDLFALTSRSEGMPLSILEAWAAGLPVVASRVGGLPELIAQGRTGLLFAPDDETELARALAELIGDPGRAQQIGARGRDRARSQFDVSVMAGRYDGHYRELLANRGRRA
jgi:sugar transferase (PEP-CTERM/EpsH1 system associated)